MVQNLNLNSDQQKKMDDIFQQNRLRLVDLTATLQKEEITMEPLMAADTPDEAKILSQIDKAAQARAELEKANARFLLGIRRILTPDQWKKLQSETAHPDGGRGPGQGPDGRGPGGPPPGRKGN
jgi:Spy/CpxP family protein refolding chaperone